MSNSTNREILLAGATAAFTIDMLVYPLDTIKTRLQSQDYLQTFASSTPKGRTQAFAVRGLYQGVGSAIIATLPAAGTFFVVYESSKTILGDALPTRVPQPTIHALASGAAELSSCLILTPAEVIKQHAQMIRKNPNGPSTRSTSLQALAMIRNSPGGATRRLWSGYTALAGRNLPFTALQFPMFEAIRAHIWRWVGKEQKSKQAGGVKAGQDLVQTGVVNGLSAAVSGSLASAVTTPTDVVKTRMMLLGGDGRGDGRSGALEGRGGGVLRVTLQVYRENGIQGLFRGWQLRAGWAALGSGLYLATYEVAKVRLKRDDYLETSV